MSDSGIQIIRIDFLLQKILDRTEFATRANLIIAITESDDQLSKDSLNRIINCNVKKGIFHCPACILSFQTEMIPYSHGLGPVDYAMNNRIRDMKYPLSHFIIKPKLEIINDVKTMKITDSEYLYNFKSPKRPKFYVNFQEYNDERRANMMQWYDLVYKSKIPSFKDLEQWKNHMRRCHFSNEEFLPWESDAMAMKRKFKKFRDDEGVTRRKQFPPLDFNITKKLEYIASTPTKISCLADLTKIGMTLYDPIYYVIQPNGIDWASMDITNRLCSNLYVLFAEYVKLGGFYNSKSSNNGSDLLSITATFRMLRSLIREARFPLTTDPESFKILAHFVILDEIFQVNYQTNFGSSFNEHQNCSVLEETKNFHVDWSVSESDLHFPNITRD